MLWECEREMQERGLTEPAAYLVIVAPLAAQSSPATASQVVPPAGPEPTSVPTPSLSAPQASLSAPSSIPNPHSPHPSNSSIELTGNPTPGRPSYYSNSNHTSSSSQAAPTILVQTTERTSFTQPSVNNASYPSSPRNPPSIAESPIAQSAPESSPSDSLHSTPASAAKSNNRVSQAASQALNENSTLSHLIKPVAPRGLCKECGKSESECVLLPCGHLALCFTCVQLPSSSLCPVCHSPVHSIVRTFLA